MDVLMTQSGYKTKAEKKPATTPLQNLIVDILDID